MNDDHVAACRDGVRRQARPFATHVCGRGTLIPHHRTSEDTPVLALLSLTAAYLLAVTGCGNTGVKTVPVSGTVTLDAKPLADTVVIFQPTTGSGKNADSCPGSQGTTDANGHYELSWPGGSGAVVGQHQVTLLWKDPNRAKAHDGLIQEPKKSDFKLPRQARDGTLKFVVPAEGTKKADFAFRSR